MAMKLTIADLLLRKGWKLADFKKSVNGDLRMVTLSHGSLWHDFVFVGARRFLSRQRRTRLLEILPVGAYFRLRDSILTRQIEVGGASWIGSPISASLMRAVTALEGVTLAMQDLWVKYPRPTPVEVRGFDTSRIFQLIEEPSMSLEVRVRDTGSGDFFCFRAALFTFIDDIEVLICDHLTNSQQVEESKLPKLFNPKSISVDDGLNDPKTRSHGLTSEARIKVVEKPIPKVKKKSAKSFNDRYSRLVERFDLGSRSNQAIEAKLEAVTRKNVERVTEEGHLSFAFTYKGKKYLLDVDGALAFIRRRDESA